MSFTMGGRDVRVAAGARAVSWLGDEVALVALMLRAQAHGQGAGTVAALMVANALPLVLLSGVTGRLVDRCDSRRLLVLSSAAQAGVCTVLAFVPSQPAVLALLALLGAGQAVNSATWSALLPAIVTAEELPKAVGLVSAGTTLAGILAPAAAGLLYAAYGTRVPLLVDAASFLALLVAAVLIRTRRAVKTRPRGKQHGGLAIVRRDPLLRPLVLMLALFVLLGAMVNVVDVFLIRGTLGAGALWYGLAGATYSIGAFAGAIGAGRLRGAAQLATGLVAGCAVLAAGLAAMGVVPSVVWLLPIGVVAGAGNGVLNVALNSLVFGHTDADERGRVAALVSGVSKGTQLIAFVLGGVLTTALEPRAAFVLAGGCGLLAPLLLGRAVLRAATKPEAADSTVMETVS
jgi:MFS family permease